MKPDDPAPPPDRPPRGRAVPPSSPTQAARAAIRQLAEHRLAPTPGNYRRAWREVGGPESDGDAEQVAAAAIALLGQCIDPGEPGFAALSVAIREQRWDDALEALRRLPRGSPRRHEDSPVPPAVEGRDGARLRKVNAELTEIVVSLCDAFESVADEGSWIVSQVDAVRGAVRGGADRRSLAAARQLLQQARLAQGEIARSRRDAIASLRDLLPHLLQRMARFGQDADVFGESLNEHLQAISSADSVEGIAERVRGLIADSHAVHRSVDEARREIGERSQRARGLEGEVERLERELARASERLLTDFLTHTANRAGLELAFDRALQGLRSGGGPLAIALLDIDDFKRVNDELGHQAGDGALRHLATLLQGKVGSGDTVARYGGEEFVILLPGMTEVQARDMLVRVQRELTREVYLHHATRVFITFSAGATAVQPQDSLEEAIGRADDAMYRAKNAGKNCVAIA